MLYQFLKATLVNVINLLGRPRVLGSCHHGSRAGIRYLPICQGKHQGRLLIKES